MILTLLLLLLLPSWYADVVLDRFKGCLRLLLAQTLLFFGGGPQVPKFLF